MGLLQALRRPNVPEPIAGQGLTLRFPVMEDFAQWSSLRQQSRRFLEPWEPTWPTDDLTLGAFRSRVRRYRDMADEDQAYPYFIFRGETLLGGISLNNVRRGVAQMATLGYWIGEPHARQGHMSNAISLLVVHAFEVHRFHRLEAACLPRNAASIRLLEKSGFEREGLARDYLRIAGRWEDHWLYGKVDQR